MTVRETAAAQLRELIKLAKNEQDVELAGWLQAALDHIDGKRPPRLRGGIISRGSAY
jgi:hypothetical protein